MTNHTLVQLFLQMQQLFSFALHHACHRNTSPAGYNLSNIIRCHFLAYQSSGGRIAGRTVQLGLDGLDVVLQNLQLRVADFGYLAVVALALGTLGLILQVLHLLLVLLNLVHQLALALPLGTELLLLFAEFCYLLVQLGNLRLVALAPDGLALDFELGQTAGNLIQFLGHAVALHAQLRGGLVHQVDGLVRQEALADVALRQLHRGDAGIVLDTHLVVVLVALLQSTQDADGAQLVRLVHHDGLETTLQGLVLLEVLLVFVQCRGTDGTQFAASQGRLQDVGSIHGTLATAGTHQRVNLVDEQDDTPFGLRHLVDDTLQAFLKLALVLGTGHQGTHVERVELLVLQVLGHVATDDTSGQSFYDGCLTRTRLTY